MKSEVKTAINVLVSLGFPVAQQNERSALCLLALLDLRPNSGWSEGKSPLIGITPIMEWAARHYKKQWAPNTRESIRRQTIHQFIDAGIVRRNPDDPTRATNDRNTVYQLEPDALALLRKQDTSAWHESLTAYLADRQTLVAKYAKERNQSRIPVKLESGQQLLLSPGEHSGLIRDIVEDFASRYIPGGALIYVGDTGDKFRHFDAVLLAELGVTVDTHGKMPDVVFYDSKRNWLLLVESVTSHGPVDGKRHAELANLFHGSKAGLVFVTAFTDRRVMARYLPKIAWETEVWVADAPSHLIHFNGERFLGPYLSD